MDKSTIMFFLGFVPVILQLLGFNLAFLLSAILLAFTVYEYDLPGKFLDEKDLKELTPALEASSSRLLRFLRWQTAIRSGLMVIAGTLFVSSLKPIITDVIALEKDTQTIEMQLLIPAFGGLLLALLASILSFHYFLSYYKKNKPLRIIIDKCTGADGRVMTYSGFLGFGGDLFVTITTPVIVFLCLVVSHQRHMPRSKREPPQEKFTNRLFSEISKRDEDIWVTWSKADKTILTTWLFRNLTPLSLVLMLNVGSLEYRDPTQIAFLVLLLCPCVLIYYGIKTGWSKWEYGLLLFALFNLAFLLAFIKPSAMPLTTLGAPAPWFVVFGFWSSFNVFIFASLFGSLADHAGREKKLEDFRRYSEFFEFATMFAADMFVLGLIVGISGTTGHDIFDWLFLCLGLLLTSFVTLNLAGWASDLDEGRYFGDERLATKGFFGSTLGEDYYEIEVFRYFVNCPLCGSDEIVAKLYSSKDVVFCKNCFAQWHVYVDLGGFKWAKLEITARDGAGQSLLGKRMKGYELRRIALERRRPEKRPQSPLQEAKSTKRYKGSLKLWARLHRLEKIELNVRDYFVNCPLCGSEDIEVNLLDLRDTLTCQKCSGKWHLYISPLNSRLQWVELEATANDNTGTELLGNRLDPIELLKMALRRR